MTTLLASQPRSTRRRDAVGLVVTALLYAALMAIVVPALRLPSHVERITVENPHPWDVAIDATGSDRDGWVGVGLLEPDSEGTFQDTVDHGDRWTFRFSYAGEQVEAHTTRARLERDDWHITVPDDFATVLRSSGVPEAPR